MPRPIAEPRETGDFTTSTDLLRIAPVAIAIGGLAAAVAVGLMRLIGLVTNLAFHHRVSTAFVFPTGSGLGWKVIPIPIAGALAIGLIARYGSEKIRGHGIPEALEALLVNESRVQPRVAFWKPISAAISIGTGGPFGAEGPIIMTGGSLGSLVAQCLHLTAVERRTLLVAGAAAGMSATFASPIAAVLFAIELLVFEFKPRSLVPIALASATADAVRVFWIGAGPLFPMPDLPHLTLVVVGGAVLIGVVGSACAFALTRAIYAVEDAFHRLPVHWMWWPALGAVVVGVGGWIEPRALGVGYDSIGAMLQSRLVVGTLLALLLVKTSIWVVALGSGTSGGILAPILTIGGSLGALVAHVLGAGHAGIWALLGMAAIFAGVTRTPFTSIVFPLELTHDIGALLPLLIASCIATGASALTLPRSILTEKIARRGLHLTREYHADPLQMRLVGGLAHELGLVLEVGHDLHEAAAAALAASPTTRWLGIARPGGRLVGAIEILQLLRDSAARPDATATLAELLPGTVPRVGHRDSAKRALEAMLETETSWALIEDEHGNALGIVTIDELVGVRRVEREHERSRSRHLTPIRVRSVPRQGS